MNFGTQKKTATLTLADGYGHSFHGGVPWEVTRRYILKFLDRTDNKAFTKTNNGVININTGQPSGAMVSSFANDAYYQGGFNFSYTPSSTRNAVNPQLFDDVRAGTSFAYNVPAPTGLYRLDLFFAEKKMTANGQRVFDVDVLGVPVLINFDIYRLAGMHTKLTRSIQVINTKSTLPFEFYATRDNAILSAFSLNQVPY